MKKSIRSLFFAVLSVWLICSCKDDDKVVLSTDCYISSFTLGNVKRQVTTTNYSGNDTTYSVSYGASAYPMTVDQLSGTIANKDSLPVNSNVNAVLATITSSGTVVYRKADEGDDAWKGYSSTDSIDFTSPLVFRVYAPDYSVWRDYTVKVNVHQQDGSVFTWQQMPEPGLWNHAEELKTLLWNGRIWLFCRENGAVRLFATNVSDGRTWTEYPVSGCASADLSTLTVFADKLYMSATDGTLWTSEDASAWSAEDADRSVHLLTCDETCLYALSDGRLWRSADARLWVEESLDEDPSWLPSRDLTGVAYTQENGIKRVLLVGNRSEVAYPADASAMVWSRLSGQENENTSWAYFNVAPDNAFACPRLDALQVVRYDTVLLALGRKYLDGTSHDALDGLYVSQDNGITWKSGGEYVLPEELRGNEAVLTAGVDDG
ncbi:MAG: DUF6242 domain-containing protein [Paraprevotella sp.]|nr:DUF6242 domain-containing protein [Paraprevotella sp.]